MTRKQWISARRAAGTRPSAVVWKINVQVWRSRFGVKNARPGGRGVGGGLTAMGYAAALTRRDREQVQERHNRGVELAA